MLKTTRRIDFDDRRQTTAKPICARFDINRSGLLVKLMSNGIEAPSRLDAEQWQKHCEFNCDKTPLNHKLWLCSGLCWRLSAAVGMTVTVDSDKAFEYDELWRLCGHDGSDCEYVTDGVACECGYVLEGEACAVSDEHGGGLQVKFPHLKDALFIHSLDIDTLTDQDGTIYSLR